MFYVFFFLLAFILIYLTTSPEIGWEERLQYDLFSIEWDVKKRYIDQC